MKRIDELSTSDGNYIFYDDIDFNLIDGYSGNDVLVIYVDSWNTVLNSLSRDNKINRLLGKSELDIDSILDNNPYVWIYQTSGYIDVVHETVKAKIARYSTQKPWQVPKNGLGLKNISY